MKHALRDTKYRSVLCATLTEVQPDISMLTNQQTTIYTKLSRFPSLLNPITTCLVVSKVRNVVEGFSPEQFASTTLVLRLTMYLMLRYNSLHFMTDIGNANVSCPHLFTETVL